MAKFCMNCGSPLDEGVAFCDNCGARVDAPQEAQPAQTPTQLEPQYAQPAQPYTPQPNQQPYKPNQPAPQYSEQPQKKGWLIALIIAGAAITVLAAAIILAVVFMRTPNKYPVNHFDIATEAVNETAAYTEAATEPQTVPPTEAPTEVPTAPPTEPPAPLPYVGSIGKPSATDFTWISDAQSGNLSGSFLGIVELVGKLKGEIIYDGAWELVYVTIDREAKITIEPYQINYGDCWEDESGEAPYVFTGAFDISSVNGAGSYGSINLYTFLESHGTQYAVGTFSVNNSSSADIYMIRP